MKKGAILIISALILLGSILPVGALLPGGALGAIDPAQQVNFISYNSALYWAMIHNYTTGTRSDDTGGFISIPDSLYYNCSYGSVHVAYIYDLGTGRYEEALALRDVNL